MTKVKIFKEKELISKISISGHAFYADYGNDIVCSAISMISYTIGNKLLVENEENTVIDIKEGSFTIEVKIIDDLNQILLSTLEMGLYMLQEQYGDNILIEEV